MLYSRCGKAVYHTLEKRHCFFRGISSFFGKTDNFGWCGPSIMRYFLSLSVDVFTLHLSPGSWLGTDATLASTFVSDTFLFSLIFFNKAVLNFLILLAFLHTRCVSSSALDKNVSTTGQVSPFTSSTKSDALLRSYTR